MPNPAAHSYYNLATDFYEYGWGQCFHFCRYSVGETFYQAIARHEHYLAMQIGIKPGMRVLDLGCCVGGPAREKAKFTDAHITGLNNNDYQIERATRYAVKDKLSDQLQFVKGDFMVSHCPLFPLPQRAAQPDTGHSQQMSFPDNSIDAVYAIEATVHAPKLEGVYGEIFRVLKPGGVFGVYEWFMTDRYDPGNMEHRTIRLDIEVGNGISNMVPVSEGLEAMRKVGFELLHNEDLADREDPFPWYWPLAGDLRYMQSVFDFFTCFRMTRMGRGMMHGFTALLETLRLAPPGTKKTADALATGGDALVAGGKLKIFTPMYLMVGREPAA